jgi:hypothetical protein
MLLVEHMNEGGREIHLDAFFAPLEGLVYPDLGGKPTQRQVVACASYTATPLGLTRPCPAPRPCASAPTPSSSWVAELVSPTVSAGEFRLLLVGRPLGSR